ncbi:FAD-dependent monooxygenase [Amycolatopsis lurida]
MSERGVVVAGGGIGGLALSIGLSRAGFAVTVVERADRIADVGAGLVLYPNGIRALDTISAPLGKAVRAAGHVAAPGDVRPHLRSDGVRLAEDPIGELENRWGTPHVMLLRSALQNALLDEALAVDVDLRIGREVVDHTADDSGVEVSLSDGSTVTGDLLVGTDGLRSGVRARLLGETPIRYRGYSSVRGRTAVSHRFPVGVTAAGPGIDLFVGAVGGGLLYWTAKIVAPQGEWPAKTPEAALADLLVELADWDPALREILETTDTAAGVVMTDIVDRDPVPQWTFGRVTLLGDAAHPMAPTLGQGAGMALEDAAVLTACLAEGSLADYERVRAPRTREIVLLSRRTGGVDVERAVEFSTSDDQFSRLFGWRPGTDIEGVER